MKLRMREVGHVAQGGKLGDTYRVLMGKFDGKGPLGNQGRRWEDNAVRSESRCALRLRYVDLVVSIEVAVEVCCCFTVFSS
jgi:hypothetical protein